MKEKTKAIIGLVAFIVVLAGVVVFLNTRKNSTSIDTTKNELESVTEVNESNFSEEVLNSDKKVLIDFYATWCGPCRVLKPTIKEVASEHSEIKVVSIDVDKCGGLATKYGVISIPTLVVIENGEEINRIIGAVPKEKILEICGIE